MEKTPNFEDQYQKSFESYQKYFDLSEEDLQKSILDVGAGSGDFIEYVRTKLGNEHAFAIENQVRKISSEKTGHSIANSLELPFQDNTFEIVLSKNYLPMLVDQPFLMQEVLRELIRVTKEGGKIMGDISTPEGEEKELEDDVKRDPSIRATAWLQERLEGAKQLQQFLGELKEEGFQISFKERPDDVVIIQKP